MLRTAIRTLLRCQIGNFAGIPNRIILPCTNFVIENSRRHKTTIHKPATGMHILYFLMIRKKLESSQ